MNFKILSLLFLLGTVFSEIPDDYTLVWSDEFDGDSLDEDKWTYEIGTGQWGWGNNELEYYTDRKDNVYVEDSILHIRAKKEKFEDKDYTSGRIKTAGKFGFKFGIVEAKIALPKCLGIWPAFWMLGANFGLKGWPGCGELDIIEAINDEGKVYANCHWDANGYANHGKESEKFDITEFHIYQLYWDTEYIRVSVDGKQHFEMLIKGNEGNTEEFQLPFFFIMNVAVGGNWPGFDVDDSAFPQEMKVDYIRVYQPKNDIQVFDPRITKYEGKGKYSGEDTKPEDFELIWSDEFDGDALDTKYWTYEIGWGSQGWGNWELEYYTDRKDNVYVEEGILHIRAKNEKFEDKEYTSGRIKTADKFAFKYGIVEAKIALPRSMGIWPAFWMLGANIPEVGWVACGEFDIIEARNKEGIVYANAHWDAGSYAVYGTETEPFDITEFHIYTMKWDTDYIQTFVDGKKYYEILIKDHKGNTEEFQKPFFFILNVAVGGNFPGSDNVDKDAFPQEMKVDYIRVYQ